jgi:hypothetical protein
VLWARATVTIVANLRGEIPVRVGVDGRECQAHCSYVFAGGGRVLTIETVLPDHGLALELISTYTATPDLPTQVIHLRVGPVGHPSQVSHAERDHGQLDVSSDPRACVYDHAHELVHHLHALGHHASVGLDEQAFTALERIE